MSLFLQPFSISQVFKIFVYRKAMPRVTKAQLEQHVARLEKENSELKRRISRGHDRSRSPRLPATSSQANVDMTCKALNQVRLWQQDVVVQEHRAEIQQLREELAKKDEQISFYRRGEGPVGPVLVHMNRLRCERVGIAPDSFVEDILNRRMRPVHEYFNTMNNVLRDAADVMYWGGCSYPTAIPRID
jgi:hypothetical protein